jgi:hypothetical protein
MKKAFRVGDIVSFLLVGKTVRGIITEDLGNLGPKGQRVYDIRFERDSSEPMHIVLPLGEFEPIASHGHLQTA